MPDANPNLDIKATLDASSITQNAPPAADALNDVAQAARQVGSASDDTSASTDALTAKMAASRAEMMNIAINAHRMMEGFKDIGMGGRYATQGLVDLEEGFQRMLPPMYQVPLAIAAMLGTLTILATTHHHGRGEAEAHGDAEKQAADKMKAAYDALQPSIAAYKKVLEDTLATEKLLESMQKDELTDIGAVAKAKEAALKIDQEIAIERARQTYLVKSGETDDEDEKKRLKARFEATEKDIQGSTGVNTASLELKEKQDALAATQRDLIQQRGQLEDLRNKIQAMQDQRTADAGFLAPLGITVGKDGLLTMARGTTDVTTGKERTADASAISELQKALDVAIERRIAAPEYLRENEVRLSTPGLRQEYIDEVTKQVTVAQANLERATGIQGNFAATSPESQAATQTSVDELNAKIYETQRALADLAPAIDLATKGVTLATLKDANAVIEGAQGIASTGKEIAKGDAKTAAEAARKARQTKDEHDHQEQKDLEDQIQNAIGTIDATGNKGMIEAMRKVVDLFRGKKDEASQLSELSELAAVHAADYSAYKVETSAHLRKLDGAVNSMKTRHSN